MARRFVTYNTEDQAAGLVNVDERGVLQPQSDDGGAAFPDSEEFDQVLMEDDKLVYQQVLTFGDSSSPLTGVSCIDTRVASSQQYGTQSAWGKEFISGDKYDIYVAGMKAVTDCVYNGTNELYVDTGSRPFAVLIENTGAFVHIDTYFAHGMFGSQISQSARIEIVHKSHPVAFKNSVDGKTYNLKRNSATGAVAAFAVSE